MFVKPRPGLKVRDPIRLDLIEEAGREVGDSPFWRRRLRDGDVVPANPADAPWPLLAPAAAKAANRRTK